MKLFFKKVFFLFVILFSSVHLYSQDSGTLAFIEGCKAFSSGDWNSAVIMLRKASAYAVNDTPDTYYMLVAAEMYAQDFESALTDCDFFLNNYPENLYTARVKYMKAKAMFSLGEYEKSIIEFSDFCHQFESDELYPSALFYIAEALYAAYKYDEAETIYERIITDFPECDKVAVAQFRIESIAQRSREEKLLYLLKQTGEEYLSAKEDYERQLKMYNSETITTTKEKLENSEQKNKELEEQIKELEDQIAMLKNGEKPSQTESGKTKGKESVSESSLPSITEFESSEEVLTLLKAKLLQIQYMIDEKKAKENR